MPAPRSSRRRRWCLPALISLGLGVVITVGEAWWAALQNGRVGPSSALLESRGATGSNWSGSVWLGKLRDASNFRLQSAGATLGEPPPEFLAQVPYGPWRDSLRAVRTRATPSGFWNSQAYGRPFRSMSMGFYKYQGGQTNWGWLEFTFRADTHAVPTRPILPGFLFNSAIFAVVAVLPILCLSTAWRRLAIRRHLRLGRCPACGYDTRGLTLCPECGPPG